MPTSSVSLCVSLSICFSLSLSLSLSLQKKLQLLSRFEVKEHFEISEFSILGIEQNQKLTEVSIFFFLIHFIAIGFCLSTFLSFLSLKLQQLSKFEIKEHFPRLPSFLFWVQGRIENWGISEIFFFLLKTYLNL